MTEIINKAKIGMIGAGNMGQALLSGLIKQHYPKTHICIADPSEEKCTLFKQQWDILCSQHNNQAAQFADFLILAVKPHQIKSVLEEIRADIQKNTVILSVAAGVTATQLTTWLANAQNPVIRAMPNTPALINQGITALYKTSTVTQSQAQTAEKLLSAVGQTIWIEDESLMNVVTALSGSGPAYFFYILEGLIAAAEKMGLPKNIAQQLAMQTAKGSIAMAQQSNFSLEALRAQVTSKGGTTERGLEVLSEHNLFSTLEQTIKQAALRGQALSEQAN
jgi:pyrroline-5-carboxylate reductase